jgi:phage terminase large subunit-like protein
MTPEQIAALPRKQREELLLLLAEKDRREKRKRYEHLFPDETHTWRGEVFHARHLYGPHIEFLDSTGEYNEVAMMAGNRTGKSEAGGYAVATWLTGRYPHWWAGRRFPGPVRVWVAGDTNETTRDILQSKLLGEVEWEGKHKAVSATGLIPGDAVDLTSCAWRQGVADLLDTVRIRHESGGYSVLGFKSYQQGRKSFQGTAQHVVWLDEEPPADVYTEALTRTATTGGLLIATFTPLSGLSAVAKGFLPGP